MLRFFLNADKTIYARYGVRSSAEHADRDVHVDGLARTMEHVMDLHRAYPGNRDQLVGKQPVKVPKDIPEDYGSLSRFKSELNYEKNVAKSCIHCHQIRDAKRVELRDRRLKFPENLLFPYPPPSTIGLHLDPRSAARVARVDPRSEAARSGLKKGDVIVQWQGQAIASAADIVWMLHHAAREDSFQVVVRREGRMIRSRLELEDGWRTRSDISWRPTTWDLRRMATGGAVFEPANHSTRVRLELAADETALRVKHVGQYGQHARAKKAGIQVGDILVEVNGRNDLTSESQLIQFAIQELEPGDSLKLVLMRGKQRIRANLVVK